MSGLPTLNDGPGVYREQGATCLPAFLLPPMPPVDVIAPGRTIAADLQPAADAVLTGRPYPA